MDAQTFFDALTKHYSEDLPFVVYSRPVDSKIKCWLQNDDAYYTTNTFTESGFVFSPFNLDEKSILIPSDNSTHLSIKVEMLDVEMPANKTTTEPDSQSHIKLVTEAIKTIEDSDLSKVVLSRCKTETIQDDPITVFKRLFNTYKNAMVYCWYHPKVGLWLGATPELLLKVEGKQLTTISLAGTKPYNKNNEVQWSAKELEEQQIVTDYITEQIKPYVQSIKTSNIETVRAGQLLHLKTRITARLDHKDSRLEDIILALHPTPAVCGFPKTIAKAFILNNEDYNREFYTGFLGELNLKSTNTRNINRRNVENNAYGVVKTQSNFYVNLRCMQIQSNKALIYVGGGITKASEPQNEWNETVEKTKTMLKVL
ncbi:chorismate-binding protein [Winogradskyella immobilis]|uniref:Chorismate-binding protein n=1 Tax=Winogradskyella immobilis TaxID=2816852 RepID=A0ABS8EKF3_9FLAO|nr:chorismate-binding protein [Winogradskyella immobilis]MCC1483694.1 chorismate-binding protein [Winogradskyella immobilis]MCG0015788.1 chorismate-binding protein [Winogradskyella immobilis]